MKRRIIVALGLVFALTGFGACKKEDDARAKEIAQYRANKMAIYQRENAEYDDYEVDVAFLGDSLTDLYDVQRYYPQYVVSNRGIGGDTTVGLEERLQVSLYDLKPKVAVMLIGANNIQDMFINYECILQGFCENVPDTNIILLSLTSMSGDWGKNNQLASYNNVKIELLAEKYGFAYVDLYAPLLDLSTGEVKAEYVVDGAHFTSAGYEVLTREITPEIQIQLALWEQEHAS